MPSSGPRIIEAGHTSYVGACRCPLRKNCYKKIDPKLAHRFQTAIEKAVQGISRQPLLMEAKEYDIRRWPVGNGFPHGVLYRNGSEEVLVLAVFHPSRDPEIWKGRADS